VPHRVVVVGGGIAGLYFTYRLLSAAREVEVVLVDLKDYHEFVVGVPMAVAGLVEFKDLLFPFRQLTKAKFVKARVAAVDERCARPAEGSGPICGDYLVLAPGALHIGSAQYWSVEGSAAIAQAAAGAKAVRFIVNELTPVAGFQELAYAIKSRWPEKEVSIHVVYIGEDYRSFMEVGKKWAQEIGLEMSDEPPPWRPDELYIKVPAARPHPLAAGLEVDPTTFETQYERVYLIGDSSLLKLGLPPIGWGALWQAATLAKAIAKELESGVFEVEAETWLAEGDKEKFLQWMVYRMTSGTPVIHLKGLYDLWRGQVWRFLSA